MTDLIVFQDEDKAHAFYLTALSLGIVAKWRGADFSYTKPFWRVEIDGAKTAKLKNKEEYHAES